MKRYEIEKQNAREEAIEFIIELRTREASFGEFFELQQYFEKIGKRYGLLREFRENGII